VRISVEDTDVGLLLAVARRQAMGVGVYEVQKRVWAALGRLERALDVQAGRQKGAEVPSSPLYGDGMYGK
jgi:hypothetical protein